MVTTTRIRSGSARLALTLAVAIGVLLLVYFVFYYFWERRSTTATFSDPYPSGLPRVTSSSGSSTFTDIATDTGGAAPSIGSSNPSGESVTDAGTVTGGQPAFQDPQQGSGSLSTQATSGNGSGIVSSGAGTGTASGGAISRAGQLLAASTAASGSVPSGGNGSTALSGTGRSGSAFGTTGSSSLTRPTATGDTGMGGYEGFPMMTTEDVESVVSEVLAMNPQSLQTMQVTGKSVADIAASRGINIDLIVDALIERQVEGIQEYVAAGWLTESKATLLLKDLRDRTRNSLRTPFGYSESNFKVEQAYVLDLAASTIGISTSTLLDRLRQGNSIAQVLYEGGVDPEQAVLRPSLAYQREQLLGLVSSGVLKESALDATMTSAERDLRLFVFVPLVAVA